MRIVAIIMSILFCSHLAVAADDISPYQFSDAERQNGFSEYKIPESSIFSVARSDNDAPAITYYFSKPKQSKKYPIVIFCSGSQVRGSVSSIIHVHLF